MSAIIKLFDYYFLPHSSVAAYQKIAKKDDDDLSILTNLWIQTWTLSKTAIYEDKKVQKVAKDILKNLNDLPLNDSNVSQIKLHLAKISRPNAYLNRLIMMDCIRLIMIKR